VCAASRSLGQARHSGYVSDRALRAQVSDNALRRCPKLPGCRENRRPGSETPRVLYEKAWMGWAKADADQGPGGYSRRTPGIRSFKEPTVRSRPAAMTYMRSRQRMDGTAPMISSYAISDILNSQMAQSYSIEVWYGSRAWNSVNTTCRRSSYC
jgi:hypothetical protein